MSFSSYFSVSKLRSPHLECLIFQFIDHITSISNFLLVSDQDDAFLLFMGDFLEELDDIG